MTEPDFDRLESVLTADDQTFKRELGDVVSGFEEAGVLAELLVEHPETFERLSARLGTIDDPEAIAETDPEAITQSMRVIFGGMRLIAQASPDVQEAITEDVAVNWEVKEYDLGWHLQTDATEGTIDGGPGLLDDPTLTFVGSLDVLLSMTGDEEFNGTLAFIQNRFELIGPIHKARKLDSMMDTVTNNARELASRDLV